MNKNIIITSDSGCDLCDLPFLGVPTKMIYSYVVDENDVQYKDRLDTSNEEICNAILSGKIFKTSAPNIYNFTNFFQSVIKEHEYVIHLSIGSEISYSAYSNSKVVAKEINKLFKNKKIHVVNTKNASGGSMVVAFFLIELLKKYNIDDAIDILKRDYIPNVINKFIVPNPTGFVRSGRNKTDMSKKEIWNIYKIRLMMSLGFKFELEISDGKFNQSKLIKTSLNNMGNKFIDSALPKNENLVDNNFLVIGETFSDNNLLDCMSRNITLNYNFKNIIKHSIGNTLTAYGCKNVLNISYLAAGPLLHI